MSKHSLRMTPQRRIILEELREVHTHPTAGEIYEIVRKRLPRISLGTVYRNLEILSEIGMIQKLEMAGAQKRFDGTVENHYHVRCVRCGRVDDVLVDTIPMVNEALAESSDYEILWHRLEFVGLCPQCKKERRPTREGEEPRIGIPDRPMSNVG
ncbi:MAG: Fur family transcriptional regulator [Desulfomonilaceae bacterium]